MRKLSRGAEPAALARLRREHVGDSRLDWSAATKQDRENIWQALDAMQRGLCAYCEGKLEQKKRHIEHFVPRHGGNSQSGVTFAWTNLFGSCSHEYSCGKYKDQVAKEWRLQDLIKPDQDQPDEFLRFLSSGEIQPQEGLDAERRRRAQETIRVFNLDHPGSPLRAQRKEAIEGWLISLDEILSTHAELAEFGVCTQAEADAATLEELDAILRNIEGLPFTTAIRHVLQSRGNA